jgi:ATP/maltotriose-dependent transcriptional regulator MalT
MNKQKTITMTGKEIWEKVDKEVAAEALKHLVELTEKYTENAAQIFKTYMPEMALTEAALVLSLTSIVGQTAVILGSSKAVDSAIQLVTDKLREQG